MKSIIVHAPVFSCGRVSLIFPNPAVSVGKHNQNHQIVIFWVHFVGNGSALDATKM